MTLEWNLLLCFLPLSPSEVLAKTYYYQWSRGLGVGLWTLACFNRGFESRRGHACVSHICLCCQVEVSASGWSLVQRNPADCGVSECESETSQKRLRTNMIVEPQGWNLVNILRVTVASMSQTTAYRSERERGLGTVRGSARLLCCTGLQRAWPYIRHELFGEKESCT